MNINGNYDPNFEGHRDPSYFIIFPPSQMFAYKLTSFMKLY